MEGGNKSKDAKMEMGLTEAINILTLESLTSVTIGDYLVVMRADFDLAISGEPYIGLVLLFNLKNGLFISRIWNQTVATGYVFRAVQFLEICRNHFGGGRPCLGYPDHERNTQGKQDFLISQTPVPRKIAVSCHKVLGKDAHDSISSCLECTKLEYMDTNENGEMNSDASALSTLEDCAKGELLSADDFQDDLGIKVKIENFEDSTESKVRNVCPLCDRIYASKSAVYNHKVCEHFWGEFCCPEGDFEAEFATDLIDHIKQAQQSDDLEVPCPHCEDNFLVPYIVSHYEHCVKDRSNLRKRKLRENIKDRNEEKTKCLQCPYCDLVMVSSKMSFLHRHMNLVHGIKNNETVGLDGRFKCQWCEASYQKSGMLYYHKTTTHSWGSFHCPECQTGAQFAKELVDHMKEAQHSEYSEIMCPRCGEKFIMSHIVGHYKECTEALQERLSRQKRKKRYPCQYCDITCANIKSLEKHMKRMHKEMTEKSSYQCKPCNFQTNCKTAFSNHMKLVDHKQQMQQTFDETFGVRVLVTGSAGALLSREELDGKNQEYYSYIMRQNVRAEDKISPDFSTPCPICLKFFPSTKSLASHMCEGKSSEHEKVTSAATNIAQDCTSGAEGKDSENNKLSSGITMTGQDCTSGVEGKGSEHNKASLAIAMTGQNCTSGFEGIAAEEENVDIHLDKDKHNQQFFEAIMKNNFKASSKVGTITQKLLRCEKCPHKTLTKHALEQHMKTRHFFGQFNCPQCGMNKEYADDLIAHMKSEGHIQNTSIQCPLCEERVVMSKIMSHYKVCLLMDKKEKKRETIICTTCGKSVKTTGMADHNKIHLRELFGARAVRSESTKRARNKRTR